MGQAAAFGTCWNLPYSQNQHGSNNPLAWRCFSRCSKAKKSGEGLTSRTQDSFPAVAASEINGWPSKGVLFMFAEAVEPDFLDNTIPVPIIYIYYTLKNYHNYHNLSCVYTLACFLLAWNPHHLYATRWAPVCWFITPPYIVWCIYHNPTTTPTIIGVMFPTFPT